MKYKFTTTARVPERVEIDRSIFTGKVKVYVDGKQVSASHRGKPGAAGTYYPLKFGTLEVRSSLFELVPRAWYNEDWVELAPPVKPWQYLVAAFPLIPALALGISVIPWIVALVAFAINLILLRSQRSTSVRMTLCVVTAMVTVTLIYFVIPIALNMLMSNSGG